MSAEALVSLNENAPDMEVKALKILDEFGPFQVATPSADIYPAKNLDNDYRIWLITYPHCDDIFNFINVGENFAKKISEDDAVNIALAGRDNRKYDADNPRIIAIERGE